ncbi:hypothetical protein Agub_g13238 [Astrephomene gubernaculifera]|uniref:Uncharacterized protein n=1 Tax=Astrephomene gubernaculifera TaxID=47775 RepID=A0AAD3E1I2_9CHLO|nr:hypothetical protein Agub_g13238 [Astrephomene gubernaculifera]
MEEQKRKGTGSSDRLTWRRAGASKSQGARGATPSAGTSTPPGKQLRPSQANRPVALHTHSYTYVFGRLSHHTHRTQIQRAFCEGLHGAPPAEPNSGFYDELDERLRLQHNTLLAVRRKAGEEALAATRPQSAATADTVALRHAVNNSLAQQLEFFTSCMAAYSSDPATATACSCSCPGCGCSCRTGSSGGLLAAQSHR